MAQLASLVLTTLCLAVTILTRARPIPRWKITVRARSGLSLVTGTRILKIEKVRVNGGGNQGGI